MVVKANSPFSRLQNHTAPLYLTASAPTRILPKKEHIMMSKEVTPLNNPPSRKPLSSSSTILGTGVGEGGEFGVEKSERTRKGRGGITYALLRCPSCPTVTRASYYTDKLPKYIKCAGCGELYPSGSFGVVIISNEPI